ncbi:MAG: anthranilate phosphoribosyltransferase [Gammaproteobacteria bacterium]|nr:anthranilate phosphoribosyltransferase [Gammaproteobacteria bacterium]
MDIQAALARLVEREDLTQDETRSVFLKIMSGEATSAQIGALLTALRVKGETPEEIAGAAETMRELSIKVVVDVPYLVDTCGTGGSGGAKLFNISTAAALVAAATGARVAKHGNRKMTSFSGSADVLEAAGVNIGLTPEQIARCISEVGVGFLFAQTHHSAMRFAAPVRQELGVRTLMNVLGPLTNPAGARRQVIGVFASNWQHTLAEVLDILGAEHVLIVHSRGLDELSLDGPSTVCELKGGAITEFEITPEAVDLSTQSIDDLHADSPESSLTLLRQSLTEPDSAAAEIVAFNAGAAIYAAGVATSFKNGVAMAQDAIAAGLAKEKLDELVRISSLMGEP